MARTEAALKNRIIQLKKMIALLLLGGAGTRAETDKLKAELKGCQDELMGLSKK